MIYLNDFEAKTSNKWNNIQIAHDKTIEKIALIKNLFKEPLSNTDVDMIVYGSLGRKECTEGSDVDWTLLIDGQADSRHLKTAQRIKDLLDIAKLPQPGTSGLFGNVTISHDLIHNIGGQNDTNNNITKRILLLLESSKIPLTKYHENIISNRWFRI